MSCGRWKRVWIGAASLFAAAGCLSDKGTGPSQPVTPVALGPSAYALYGGNQSGLTLHFPAADTGGAQYLVVGQLATSVPDLYAAFDLVGTAGAAAMGAAPPAARRPLPASVRFHDHLLSLDETAARASAGFRPSAAAPARVTAPVLGTVRAFGACGDLNCQSFVTLTAKALYVGTHAAIYVDTLAPAGGLDTASVRQLGAQVDSVLYPIDTVAFGAPSDVDANGVVLILLTPAVNVLTPTSECQNAINGYSLAVDLAPSTRTQFNDGEVFYGVVPDPSGVWGCALTTAAALAALPPTFIHEFQHMISFNQHVLIRGGNPEVLWLNEGLSRLAEELGGRHYDSLGADSVGDNFLLNDLYDAYLYEQTPAPNPMVTVTSPTAFETSGAGWLFVRYLVDQYGTGVIQRLEQTALQGGSNVAGATGLPLSTLLGQWALALYVSDLPGFMPDPALTYKNWAFRTTFLSLNAQFPQTFTRPFPLVPATAAGGAFSLLDVVASGSGTYLIVTQAASGPAFSINFTVANTGASADPQLAVIRLR